MGPRPPSGRANKNEPLSALCQEIWNQDMGVDHRGSDILVAEKFLHGANVITGFEQMGGPAQMRDKLRNAGTYGMWLA